MDYGKEERIALMVKVGSNEEEKIPFTIVKGIGDMILITSSIEAEPEGDHGPSCPKMQGRHHYDYSSKGRK